MAEKSISRTAEIVSAYVTRNALSWGDLTKMMTDVHRAIVALDAPVASATIHAVPTPAVPVKKSITPDFIICLEDGQKFRSMKRHLSKLGLTPDEYRARWGLKPDYPMVAPNYSAKRSGLAKANGLGRKPGAKPEAKRAAQRRA